MTKVGKYTVHEVAAMFPMLPKGSREYNELEEHIRTFGQLEPIVVDGEILLDGRNRMLVCEALKQKPIIVEWSSLRQTCQQHEWIFGKNWTRRDLKPDQKGAIFDEYNRYEIKLAAEENQRATQFKPGSDSRRNTSSGPKKLATQVSESPARDRKTSNANSTVGKLAAKAGISRYKAEQIVSISKLAESGDGQAKEDLEKIKLGLKTVREVKQNKKASSPKPLAIRLQNAWEAFWKRFEPSEKPQVIKWIREQL